MTARATIQAGVCGFRTSVAAVSQDAQYVQLDVQSTCAKITDVVRDLPLIDAYSEIRDGFDGVLYRRVREVLKGCCAGCVVPPGLFKCMQVAASLALPAKAGVELSKDE